MDILEVYDWELKHPDMTKGLLLALAVDTTKELAERLDELQIASMDAAYEKFVKLPMQDPNRVEMGLNRYGDIEFLPSDFKKVSFSYEGICSKLASYKVILSRLCAATERGLTSENITAAELVTDLLERIKQINAEVYFITEFVYTKVKEYESDQDYIQAARALADSLFFRGTLETTYYRMSLTIDKGAVVMPEIQTSPAYLSVQLTTDHVYHYEEDDTRQSAKGRADFVNSSCRIFKCSNCGTITYERLVDDNQRLARGLQPQQYCVHCRLTGKTNFFENDMR